MPADYAQEWVRLQDAHADPAIELAKTKQAVLVSAASVLDRVWNGNGGLGWIEECEEDYIAPLREHLSTDAIFSEAQRSLIAGALDEIVATGRENRKRLEEAGEKETTLRFPGRSVDLIVQHTIEWCRQHPEPIQIADDEEYHGHF